MFITFINVWLYAFIVLTFMYLCIDCSTFSVCLCVDCVSCVLCSLRSILIYSDKLVFVHALIVLVVYYALCFQHLNSLGQTCVCLCIDCVSCVFCSLFSTSRYLRTNWTFAARHEDRQAFVYRDSVTLCLHDWFKRCRQRVCDVALLRCTSWTRWWTE